MEFEKNLKDLEQIVEKMSDGKLNLTDSIKSFKTGMDLISKCQKSLKQAEQSVEKLIKVNEDGSVETESFDPDETKK